MCLIHSLTHSGTHQDICTLPHAFLHHGGPIAHSQTQARTPTHAITNTHNCTQTNLGKGQHGVAKIGGKQTARSPEQGLAQQQGSC